MFRRTSIASAIAVVVVSHASIVFAAATKPAQDEQTVMVPSGKGYGVPYFLSKDRIAQEEALSKSADAAANGPSPSAASNGISYHNGPVMLGTTKIYYIWYGNWSGNSATTILANLASNLGGSPYYNINTTYYNGSGTHVSNAVSYSGSTTDSYSGGTSLTDAEIQSSVSSAITSGRLPKSSTAVYFVLTSSDVTASSGFCTQYCGWHDHATISGTDIKYSFVGNPATKCPSSCGAKSPSPNGNAGADAMASIISHELEEAVTDPDLNAWYDTSGNENADKCAWTFGTQYTTSNGSKANMLLGNRNFLIQQNWVNAGGGYCAKSY